jgi:PAS domain S-box-containing protein
LNAPIGIATSDTDTRFLSANKEFCQILGYTEDELQKVTFKDITYPEDLNESRAKMDALSAGKIPFFNIEKRYLKKDGAIITGQIIVNAIRDQEGNPRLFIAELEDITERKKIENAVRQSEAKYRTLYKTVSGGIVVEDTDGRIIEANDMACELLGLSLDQMQGRTSMDPRWQSIREDGTPFPGEEHPVMVTLRTGKPVRNTIMGIYHPKEGTHKWIQINSDPVIDPESSKVTSAMATFIDITEHKNLEQKLLASEKKYRSLFYSMNEGVCLHKLVYDASGKAVDYIILDANSVYEDITGIKREDAIGKRASKLYGVKEAPYLEIYAKVAETGEPTALATYFAPMEKYFSISVFSPAKGKFATVFTDITERRKQEELLRESKQKFELLFAKNPEAIVLVDEDLRVKEVNPAFTRLFGFSNEELVKMFLPDLVVPDNFKQGAEKLRDKAKSGRVNVETVRKRKDGSEIHVALSIEPIIEQNKFAGFIVVYKDISEIVQAKHQLEKALQETQVLNEKLNVIGGLTRHDVRNKLHGIVGLTYLLEKKQGENAEVTSAVERINLFAEQIAKILDFSGAYEEIGMEPLKMVNAEECFSDACALFSDEGKDKAVNELQGLKVLADSLLQKVFYNLIDNSLRHGEKVTCIRAYFKKEPDRVKLIYEDDGVGISEADKKRLFTEGFTGGKGSGYGLFLIQKLMEVYGWTIQENGKPGEGVRFVITIPQDSTVNSS